MSKEAKNKYPPHTYLEGGKNWKIDFLWKGKRYKENLGCVSRTIAKEKAANRKTAVAEGRLAVGGHRWIDGQWVAEIEKPKIVDVLFETACDKYLEWCRAHLRPRSHERAIDSSKALK